MDWELENANYKLQDMITVYETEIAELTHENAKLMEEDIKRVDMLTDVEKRELIDDYYKLMINFAQQGLSYLEQTRKK